MTTYRTMQGLVVEALRQQILSGELAPGSHLYQEKLASGLGVSRQPVREALRQLEVQGYVTFEPHRGVVVKELSRDDVEELYVLRSAIEEFAANLAVAKTSAETLRRMRTAQRRMVELEKAGASGSAFLLPDAQFHHAFYESTERKGLIRRILDLEDNSHRYVREYIDLPGSRIRAIATHRKILKAVESGDPTETCRAVVDHLESTVSGVLRALDQQANMPVGRRKEGRGW